MSEKDIKLKLKLKLKRVKKGLTQAELERLANLPVGSVSRLERGYTPSVSILKRLESVGIHIADTSEVAKEKRRQSFVKHFRNKATWGQPEDIPDNITTLQDVLQYLPDSLDISYQEAQRLLKGYPVSILTLVKLNHQTGWSFTPEETPVRITRTEQKLGISREEIYELINSRLFLS
jgi:transcriptional regulator with XRE-family HTH domain